MSHEKRLISFSGQSPICTDIDECALEIDDCQQGTVCHNLPGFYRCIEEFRTVSKIYLHLDFTLVSLRFHADIIMASPQFHPDFTLT